MRLWILDYGCFKYSIASQNTGYSRCVAHNIYPLHMDRFSKIRIYTASVQTSCLSTLFSSRKVVVYACAFLCFNPEFLNQSNDVHYYDTLSVYEKLTFVLCKSLTNSINISLVVFFITIFVAYIVSHMFTSATGHKLKISLARVYALKVLKSSDKMAFQELTMFT